MLELEVINCALVEVREALIERKSELVLVGKRATDVSIEEQSRGYIETLEVDMLPTQITR